MGEPSQVSRNRRPLRKKGRKGKKSNLLFVQKMIRTKALYEAEISMSFEEKRGAIQVAEKLTLAGLDGGQEEN